jgi:hypothetical protein
VAFTQALTDLSIRVPVSLWKQFLWRRISQRLLAACLIAAAMSPVLAAGSVVVRIDGDPTGANPNRLKVASFRWALPSPLR